MSDVVFAGFLAQRVEVFLASFNLALTRAVKEVSAGHVPFKNPPCAVVAWLPYTTGYTPLYFAEQCYTYNYRDHDGVFEKFVGEVFQ